MKIRKTFIYYLIFLFLLYIIFILKPDFDINDGFYSQIKYILKNGFGFDLYLVHAARVFIMSPIIFFKLYDNFLFLFLGTVLYTLPLYKYYLNKKRRSHNIFLLLFLLIMAIVFNERTFIATLGFLYLLIYYTENKKSFLFILSFSFAILSSGTFLIFLILMIIFNNYIYKINFTIKLLIGLIFASPMFFSIQNKLIFFALQKDGFLSIIERSRIIESYMNENYTMFFFLLIFLTIILLSIVILASKHNPCFYKHIIILTLGIFTVLFEGLAAYTYVIAIYFLIVKNLSLRGYRYV